MTEPDARPVRLREVSFICHMCMSRFRSTKQQDPQRDRGYGTCPGCKDAYVVELVKFGYSTRTVTTEQAEQLYARYA
jgi:hypothetical protein